MRDRKILSIEITFMRERQKLSTRSFTKYGKKDIRKIFQDLVLEYFCIYKEVKNWKAQKVSLFVRSEIIFNYRKKKNECSEHTSSSGKFIVAPISSEVLPQLKAARLLTDRILRRCVNGGKQIWFLTVPSGCFSFLSFPF